MVHAFGREHAEGVREAEPRAAGLDVGRRPLQRVAEVRAAGVLGGELDALDALAARVAHGIGDHADVGLAVELERRVEPLRFGASFPSQQGPAELVFQVQVRERRQDEHRHVPGPGAGLGHALEHAVDVPGHGPAHRQDVQARPQLAVLLSSKDVAQGLPVAVGRDREGHVHDVDAHLGQQLRQLQLLRR